ncbi:hypothetical protein C8N32_10163 [Rhodovulum imhoffii]|uniref:Uncharacterized protein n=1 Tax=Rhodovulum imhoffii TaxID=365340 RepID=A0A2T5BW48_9RHOB|nr:hypothetical protein [Rhodovulum imhoffii]MBK5935163.1 hypothetical protein [Rhodovulum imhoffii]PTN03869.1 hypothetical protein C8N32_10163 [Rhodovulum imhoffii]
MARTWHILREEGALTMARRLPVRFDLAVETTFPQAGKRRLAAQIRQDMWRALKGMRGFSPAVRVEDCKSGLRVVAGGQVSAPFPRALAEARVSALLADPVQRLRWLRCARTGERP